MSTEYSFFSGPALQVKLNLPGVRSTFSSVMLTCWIVMNTKSSRCAHLTAGFNLYECFPFPMHQCPATLCVCVCVCQGQSRVGLEGRNYRSAVSVAVLEGIHWNSLNI